jgi:limonene-1,2-epoxide hydrolase
MDHQQIRNVAIGTALGIALGYSWASSATTALSKLGSSSSGKDDEVVRVVTAFLDAQSERNLDKMCALVDEEVVYINEPHPPERAIRGRKMFRDVFAESPCIWCEKANLQVLQLSHQPGSDTVFVERFDQFFIDGSWLAVPICGYLKVKNGKVVLWKDYWDYAKYRQFVDKTYGPGFRLFRKTVKQ